MQSGKPSKNEVSACSVFLLATTSCNELLKTAFQSCDTECHHQVCHDSHLTLTQWTSFINNLLLCESEVWRFSSSELPPWGRRTEGNEHPKCPLLCSGAAWALSEDSEAGSILFIGHAAPADLIRMSYWQLWSCESQLSRKQPINNCCLCEELISWNHPSVTGNPAGSCPDKLRPLQGGKHAGVTYEKTEKNGQDSPRAQLWHRISCWGDRMGSCLDMRPGGKFCSVVWRGWFTTKEDLGLFQWQPRCCDDLKGHREKSICWILIWLSTMTHRVREPTGHNELVLGTHVCSGDGISEHFRAFLTPFPRLRFSSLGAPSRCGT